DLDLFQIIGAPDDGDLHLVVEKKKRNLRRDDDKGVVPDTGGVAEVNSGRTVPDTGVISNEQMQQDE
ncbi:unnamed protein product, partial [Amoebophrya sp. A25]